MTWKSLGIQKENTALVFISNLDHSTSFGSHHWTAGSSDDGLLQQAGLGRVRLACRGLNMGGSLDLRDLHKGHQESLTLCRHLIYLIHLTLVYGSPMEYLGYISGIFDIPNPTRGTASPMPPQVQTTPRLQPPPLAGLKAVRHGSPRSGSCLGMYPRKNGPSGTSIPSYQPVRLCQSVNWSKMAVISPWYTIRYTYTTPSKAAG